METSSLPDIADIIQGAIDDFGALRDVESLRRLRAVLERSTMAAIMRAHAVDAGWDGDLDSQLLCERASDQAISDAVREAWG